MANDCYLSFCPIAKVGEVIEPRWTLLILCELFNGATRFNEIHRGIPDISPTLLSRRLKEMEHNGLVIRRVRGPRNEISYHITQAAEELKPIVHALGKWAFRNVDREVTMEHLDVKLLMWNVRRKVDVARMPPARQWVVRFTFDPDMPGECDYWLVVRPGQPTDLCTSDPGQDVDLFVHAGLKPMTSVFLGYTTLLGEVNRGTIQLTGARDLAATMKDWFVPSVFSFEDKALQTV